MSCACMHRKMHFTKKMRWLEHAHACMHMPPFPFPEDGRGKLHGRNLAAALLEGAVQEMDSALKNRSGEIPAMGGVPCTAPQSAMPVENLV